MKQFCLIFIGLSLLISLPSQASRCIWVMKNGQKGPSIFTCGNGKKKERYYYGDMSCGKKTYKDVFCHSKFTGSGPECYQDKTEKTLACKAEKQKALAKTKSHINLGITPSMGV